jgi:tetratricopeptide (TPR) repeat protein
MSFAEEDRDGDTLAELARIAARCLYHRGRLTEARTALMRAERVPASASLRSLLLAHGATLLALRGESEQAKQWAEQALELALNSTDEDLLLQARWASATVLGAGGDLAAAKQQIEAASHLSGTRIHRAEMDMLTAVLALDLGDIDEAIAGFRRVDAEFLACGYVMNRPMLWCNLAESLTATGQLDEADRVLAEAMALTSSNERTARVHVLLELGRLALARGDAAQAATSAREALTLAEQEGYAHVIEQLETSGLREAIREAGSASPPGRVGSPPETSPSPADSKDGNPEPNRN